MTLVTIFRHVPPPIIGIVGVLPERRFEAFEKELDWLETTGVLVERRDPRDHTESEASRQAGEQLLASEGNCCLPLIVVDGLVVSRGVYPTRAQLARLIGRGRQGVRLEVARQLATIGAAAALGADDEVRSHTLRARELGIGPARVQAAIQAGATFRHERRTSPAA